MSTFSETSFDTQSFSTDSFDITAAVVAANVPRRKPVTRTISVRSISHAIAGPEQDYPVYRFSGRNFVERPGHNPFKNL